MSKKTLNLESLKVASFVTDIQKDSKDTVKGGFPSWEVTGCTGVCCGTLTPSGHSGAYGDHCRAENPNCGPLQDF